MMAPIPTFLRVFTGAASELEKVALARRRRVAEDPARSAPDQVQLDIAASRLVTEQVQAADAVGLRELRAVLPRAVAPAAVAVDFVRREMRIQDDRRRTARQFAERRVDRGVAELVVGR